MWNRTKTETIVVLLLRSQLSIFSESSGKISNYPFDPKLIQDLEVKDESSFFKGLSLFFQQQKLANASAILLLDNSTYFSKKMVGDAKSTTANKTQKSDAAVDTELEEKTEQLVDSNLESEKRLFVQSVPFANVFSTVLTVGKEKILIALNRDFYEPVIKALTDKEIKVIAIFPMVVVSHLFQSNGFTAQTAGLLLSTVDKYHSQNFLESTIKKEEMVASVTALPQDDSDRKRLLVLAVIFVLLIAALVGVIFWSRQRDAALTPPEVTPVVAETVVVPSPTSSPAPITPATSAASLSELLIASSSASSELSQLTIHILNASQDPQASDVLIQQLTDSGFLKITEGSAQTALSGSVRVSVLSTVPLQLREVLSTQMDTWGYKTNFQEVATQAHDIEITLTIL